MKRGRGRPKKVKIKGICKQCGKEFEICSYMRIKFCNRQCYRQWIKENFYGENHPSWKGGQTTDTKGYVFITMPNHPRANKRGYVKRARLVAEKTLGRYLYPNEIPHHRNEIKGDDRPENIEVMTEGKHQSFHRKKEKRLRGLREVNKKRGHVNLVPTKFVPIITPLLLTNDLVFRHFSRYLSQPMLKLGRELCKKNLR